MKNYKFSEEHRKNISLSKMGNKNPFFGTGPNKGKQLSEKHKEKLRLAKLKNPTRYWLGKKRLDMCGKNNPMTRIEIKKKVAKTNRIVQAIRFNKLGISPRYNMNACKIIDEYGKKHGYKFQHAMNGGEFFIKKLGYWVDGYDKKRNIVIEYYEKKHRGQTKKDLRRKNEIINCMKCKFIELKEWEK